MRNKTSLKIALLLTASLAGLLAYASLNYSNAALRAPQEEATPGSLQALDTKGQPRGLCPLKHTDVKAEISGFLSRVRVTQEFENPFKEKIEAVYTFPLPQAAAVDDMTMQVGDRTVKGKILRREEAQNVYEAAKSNARNFSDHYEKNSIYIRHAGFRCVCSSAGQRSRYLARFHLRQSFRGKLDRR